RPVSLLGTLFTADGVIPAMNVLAENGSGRSNINSETGSIVFNPGVDLRTNGQGVNVNAASNGTTTNRGSISAITPGTTISFSGGLNVFNEGQLTANNG